MDDEAPGPNSRSRSPEEPLKLGPPIRRIKREPPEWVPVPGSPGIERNTKTDRLRTNISPPTLPAQPAPWRPPKGWPALTAHDRARAIPAQLELGDKNDHDPTCGERYAGLGVALRW
jgi:hypothetical protein